MRVETIPRTVFMFSGQGSHYFQMGKELFEHEPVFREWLTYFDGLARRTSGESLLDAIYSEAHRTDVFDRTLSTHPAIFAVQYSLAQCLIHRGVAPDATLGTSLGSFVAATVAGAIDAESAMRAVIEQALALEDRCAPGGMIAVLSPPDSVVDSIPKERFELAAVNFATHFTLSAPQEHLSQIEALLGRRQITHQRLPVSFAFHSRWIDDARPPFLSFANSLRVGRPRLPLVCCVLAETLTELPAAYLWRAVREPIRFRSAIAGLERASAHRYIDLGPSGTLAAFLKHGQLTGPGSSVHSILTPFGRDRANLAALLASFESQ